MKPIKTANSLGIIKPKNQTTLESAKSTGQKIQTHINAAKWVAAQEWCKRKGIRFKVINEDQIFQNNIT